MCVCVRVYVCGEKQTDKKAMEIYQATQYESNSLLLHKCVCVCICACMCVTYLSLSNMYKTG